MKKNWKLWVGWSMVLFPITFLMGLATLEAASLIIPTPIASVPKADRWYSLVLTSGIVVAFSWIGVKTVSSHYHGNKAIVSIR